MVWQGCCNTQTSALRCGPSVLKCRFAAENLTDPGAKGIWFLRPLRTWMSFFVCEYHLGFFFFSATIKKHWQAASEFTVLFYSSPTKEPILSSLSLCWVCGGFTLSDQRSKPALCYQGKVHLFRVSSWDGFWASKSQSLFLDTSCLFAASFFPPAHNRISWECVKYCMLCTVHL